jgi:hypothetical protein
VKKKSQPIGQAKPKLTINQEQLVPVVHPERMHRRLWTVAKAFAGFLVALFGLVGTAYGIWGPVWPTEPVFVPGPLSFGSSFAVPFVVSNKSVLFDLKAFSITCRVDAKWVNLAGKTLLDLGDAEFVLKNVNLLGAGATGSYTCPFGHALIWIPNSKLEAQLTFLSEYERPWLRDRVHATSDVFTLNNDSVPPQWLAGRPLK